MRRTKKLIKRSHAVLPTQVKQAEVSALQVFVRNVRLACNEVINSNASPALARFAQI